jgi:hypothetical protein
MGNTIEQHRAAIGRFNLKCLNINLIHRTLSRQFCNFWLLYQLMLTMHIELDPYIVYILTLGMDIEKNPGPQNTDEQLKICNMNIRSINAKPAHGGITRFQAVKNAVTNTYDIVTITESWLQSEHKDSDYVIQGFQGPFRLDRPDNTAHGGVMAWVTNTLIAKCRNDLEEIDNESMWIQIENKLKQILICITYRQKKGRYAPTYWDKLQKSYDKAVESRIPNIVLIGDFNGDPSSDRAGAIDLNDFVSTNNLHHHIF